MKRWLRRTWTRFRLFLHCLVRFHRQAGIIWTKDSPVKLGGMCHDCGKHKWWS
jgi:hypothetical protein